MPHHPDRLAQSEASHARALARLAEIVAHLVDHRPHSAELPSEAVDLFVELGLDDHPALDRLERRAAAPVCAKHGPFPVDAPCKCITGGED